MATHTALSTKARHHLSREISSSIIKGSGIGLEAYIVNAADFNPVTHGNQMVKFADDTYIIIPAVNASSKQAELSNGEAWARANNLKVNTTTYSKVAFFEKRRKMCVQPPPPIPGIERTTTVKILGVTITNNLSVSEHIRTVIGLCTQTIYRSVVIAKLQYSSSAWWGFTNTSDRQRIQASIRRSVRCYFAPADLGTFEELCRAADERLFDTIVGNN